MSWLSQAVKNVGKEVGKVVKKVQKPEVLLSTGINIATGNYLGAAATLLSDDKAPRPTYSQPYQMAPVQAPVYTNPGYTGYSTGYSAVKKESFISKYKWVIISIVAIIIIGMIAFAMKNKNALATMLAMRGG